MSKKNVVGFIQNVSLGLLILFAIVIVMAFEALVSTIAIVVLVVSTLTLAYILGWAVKQVWSECGWEIKKKLTKKE